MVEEAFRRYKDQIACVIVEPVVGNMGCVIPAKGFLDGLRYLTARENALLILDEVMTGFRVAYGGATELYSVRPDLVTLGKVIGGGLPVGAYAGPAEFMDMIAPVGPVYQAGTLSGNPLAMAAGKAMLCYLHDNNEIYGRMERLAGTLVSMVAEAARDADVPLTYNRVGSMFTWFFQEGPVTDWDSAAKSDTKAFGNSISHAGCRRVSASVAVRGRVLQRRAHRRRRPADGGGGKRGVRGGNGVTESGNRVICNRRIVKPGMLIRELGLRFPDHLYPDYPIRLRLCGEIAA